MKLLMFDFFLLIFQRKLKNRVAAQTSRDRKKAKMDEMDLTIKQLYEENETLKLQFEHLTKDNEELLRRNIELEQNLNELRARIQNESNRFVENGSQSSINDLASSVSDRWMDCGIINNGSAVSEKPLLKVNFLNFQNSIELEHIFQ